jgi:hypothetical protein
LHGTTDIVAGRTRDVMENMPGVYQLLPGEAFFDKHTEPIAEFDQSVVTVHGLSSLAGSTVGGYAGMQKLLTGYDGLWKKPGRNDTRTPNILNSELLTYGHETHAELDPWLPHDGPEVVQILGVNNDTPDRIRYYDCYTKEFWCQRLLQHDLGKEFGYRETGDGTVLLAGAQIDADETYFANLWQYSHDKDKAYAHGNMLSAPPIKQTLKRLLRRDDVKHTKYVTTEPAEGGARYRARVYSPVDIHLYDENGRHTGVTRTEESEEDLGRPYEEEVPTSYYLEWGEVAHLGVGVREQEQTLTFDGTGNGAFRLELDLVDHDGSTETLVYNKVPVTKQSTGSLVLPETLDETPTLAVDVDGDGTHDLNVSPTMGAEELSVSELIDRLRVYAAAADMPAWLHRWIDKRLGLAEKQIEKGRKGNLRAAKMVLRSVLWTVEVRTKWGHVGEEDAEVMRVLLKEAVERL